ncbi:MAG: hypothetical protein JNL74_00400, partial [Fibrobacteres bacterium]|nr:hypothetical protein [Fibrobacterota bacterium]
MKKTFFKALIALMFISVNVSAITNLRVMLIGWPLYDRVNPINHKQVKSVYTIFREFEKENPDIKIEFIPAQWGSGS